MTTTLTQLQLKGNKLPEKDEKELLQDKQPERYALPHATGKGT